MYDDSYVRGQICQFTWMGVITLQWTRLPKQPIVHLQYIEFYLLIIPQHAGENADKPGRIRLNKTGLKVLKSISTKITTRTKRPNFLNIERNFKIKE